jgi:phage terminase large subunit
MKKYQVNLDTQTIDSAEGALRNQYNKDYGIYLTPARKKDKEKMIENVEDLLAQNRVYVLNTENNKIFLEEHKKYQWDEDSLKTDKPKVVKIDDHTVDAFQYYVNNNLEKLGLKI